MAQARGKGRNALPVDRDRGAHVLRDERDTAARPLQGARVGDPGGLSADQLWDIQWSGAMLMTIAEAEIYAVDFAAPQLYLWTMYTVLARHDSRCTERWAWKGPDLRPLDPGQLEDVFLACLEQNTAPP